MKKIIFASIVLLSAQSLNALYTINDRYLVGFSLGYSMPKGGTWAKQYKEAMSFSLNVEKPRNEEHAVGIEIGYDFGHKHKIITNCRPRILYISPYFKEIKNFKNVDLFASLGVGLYHRWTPAYTDNFTGVKYSTSWSGKLGANFAFGAVYAVGNNFSLSGGLKLHYIRHFIGTPAITSATNLTPFLMIQKRFE